MSITLRVLFRFDKRGVCGIISGLLVVFDLACSLQLLLRLEFIFAHLTTWARVECLTLELMIDLSTFVDVLIVADTIGDFQGVSDRLGLLRQFFVDVRTAMDETNDALFTLVETLERLLILYWSCRLDNFLLEKVIVETIVILLFF